MNKPFFQILALREKTNSVLLIFSLWLSPFVLRSYAQSPFYSINWYGCIAGDMYLAGNSGRYKGRRSNRTRRFHHREREKTVMLTQSKITMFRYGIREIMDHYEIDKAMASSIIASVIAKGSRISIDSAKTFVRGQEKTGIYSKEVTDEICDLLERFSTYR